LVPYQVKFRSAQEPLTYTEVASFLGLTERARDRVIFTNASDVARDAKTRDAIRTVRGQDFNRLTQDDFLVIERWLKHKPVQLPKRVPRPYQQEAIDRILNTFRKGDRATAVMACGTGKTLVALWVAEAIPARRVIVFVPSLALLSQTLKEWSRWTSWGRNYQYLCVCSDPTVSKGIDELRLDQIDTDFPIGTDPAQVRDFLRSTGKRIQVIFSTYQSAPVIMKGAKGLGPFDLAILDEAHKTAGVQGSAFALPLLDDKIRVKKRLFLTATPRHYDISHRDREGDFRVISMDNQALYGPVAYRLTFAEAAKKGIICNYKVVVSIVDGKEVTEFALAHGITLVDKNEIAVRWVAHQLALQKAIKKVRATRVITFHTTVRLAQRFASRGIEGIARYLKDFSVYHVNGEQPSAEREGILNAFREVKCGVITNARCLTEGVDVPAVDMIAFMNPRKSRVDIAQATGRAMRKAGPEKMFGYVVVPLFLNQHRGESLEEALDRSDFKDVANVLNAMQEQDTDLVDIIREMREARGRLGGFKTSRLREKLQVIGPRIPLDRLRSNIFVRVIDRLGLSWDEYYGKLVAYKKHHGDCKVPHLWKQDLSLGMWVAGQRQKKAKGQLSPEQIRKLDSLGYVWDVYGAMWEEMYGRLVAYKKSHGDCNVPNKWNPDLQLGLWVNTQRAFKAKGKLPTDRIKRLKDLGFIWMLVSTYWDRQYAQLAAHKKRHGHVNVPRTAKNKSIRSWMHTQRTMRATNRLSSDRIRWLDELGFIWKMKSAQWDEMFERLTAFQKKYRHCDVPHLWKEDRSLAIWVVNTRRRKDQLSTEQMQKLVAIGFDWDPSNTDLEKMYARLAAFKKVYGHCNVPSSYSKDPVLARWVVKQRHPAGSRSSDDVVRLKAMGFDWNPLVSSWEKRYKQLLMFKKQHGHCNVPRTGKNNKSFASWISHQRTLKPKDGLSPERIRRLDALGFSWNTKDAQWEAMYDRLRTYRKRHGDCNVPGIWKQDRSLRSWVQHQRKLKTKGQLSPEHIRRLDALGFIWDTNRVQKWGAMYSRLRTYKKRHGDCNVPQGWEQDRSLGLWVGTQRQRKAKGRLSSERILRLKTLGFAWAKVAAAIKGKPHGKNRST
jgi:superfamily II DNA or RNA helicase